MEVILLQKVANLGNIGDRVKVKPGFGRNYLLPQGKAALATAANVAKFEERRADLEKRAADDLAASRTRAARLEGHALSITAKVGGKNIPVQWSFHVDPNALSEAPDPVAPQ